MNKCTGVQDIGCSRYIFNWGSGRGGQCAGLNTGRLPDKPTLYWSSGQRRRLTGICFNDSKTGVS